MKNLIRHKSTVLTVLAIAIGGTFEILDRTGVLADPGLIGMASAADSHDSGGGSSSGGHSGGSGGSGGSGSSGGGHSSGSGGSGSSGSSSSGGGHSGGSGGSGSSGGGHSGGSGGSSGGHDSGGSSGGHSGGGGGGGGHSGGEAKGHGSKYKHQGHGGGQHGVTSSHEAGADRFGGGSGLRGNNQIPEGVGRYGEGHSELPDGSVARGNFRYWGGWTLPEEPGTPPPPSTDAELASASGVIPGSGGGPSVNVRSVLDTAPRCDGIASGMPAAKQFGGGNLLRLTAARGLIDPELAASGKIASPYIMGSLQNELTKGAPNAELAGTYLGLVAKAPVSADTVKKIGHQLCAGVSDSQAKEIAQVAEQQRVALAGSKGGKGGQNVKP